MCINFKATKQKYILIMQKTITNTELGSPYSAGILYFSSIEWVSDTIMDQFYAIHLQLPILIRWVKNSVFRGYIRGEEDPLRNFSMKLRSRILQGQSKTWIFLDYIFWSIIVTWGIILLENPFFSGQIYCLWLKVVFKNFFICSEFISVKYSPDFSEPFY